MNAPKWLGLAGVLAVSAVVAFLVVRGRPGAAPSLAPVPPKAVAPSERAAVPATATLPPAQPPRVAAAAPPPPESVNVMPEAGGAAIKMVRVRPQQTLGTVNGIAITLKDLVPLPADKANVEQLMSTEMFGFLLNRAIEREVTFQAARGQGVDLTEAQRQRLAGLRTRSEQVEPGVFDTVQQNPANAEFEQRDSMGLLLQATLAEKAGVPSPHVTTAQVQAYYDQHQAEYGALPADPAARQAAWERMDGAIREKLAPQLEADYQERFKNFLERLKDGAQIATAPPPS